MSEPVDLDAEAASMESVPGTKCSVCTFVEDQPDIAAWDALLAGRRSNTAVHRVMQAHGYERSTHQPVERHRRSGHRR